MASRRAQSLFSADKSHWYSTDISSYQRWENDKVKRVKINQN